jgi:hypothetical protein
MGHWVKAGYEFHWDGLRLDWHSFSILNRADGWFMDLALWEAAGNAAILMKIGAPKKMFEGYSSFKGGAARPFGFSGQWGKTCRAGHFPNHSCHI